MRERIRVGVLISGRGSNMESLIEACRQPDYPAEIALVVSNRPDAAGLGKAQAAGIDTAVVDHRPFPDRQAFEAILHETLSANKIDFVCNAGFMRLLTADFVDQWHNRQLNIHPSLLPAFKGLNTHERALNAGVCITGCTVHFVRDDMDSGPIVAQAAVSVVAGDTPDTLAERVLVAEHRLYPHALALVASGRISITGDVIQKTGDQPDHGHILMSPPLAD